MNVETGLLKIIGEKKTIQGQGGKDYTVVKFILDCGEFNGPIEFEAFGQEADYFLANYQVGQKMFVAYNVKGRSWTKDGKVSYFNSLKVTKVWKGFDKKNAAQLPPSDDPMHSVHDNAPEPEDDLPF